MSLPADLSSRIENYLGVIVGQSGAVQPASPGSRIEEYLAYIIEHGAYTLPAATASRLGGIKVGTGLSVTADGTLSLGLSNADTEEF